MLYVTKQTARVWLKRIASGLLTLTVASALVATANEPVVVDLTQPGAHHPFPHFWEHMFGSGRAALVLREAYQTDLAQTTAELPVQFVRFHGIFDDELGVVHWDKKTHQPIYNFTYVDQIYDALLTHQVKPFVELSFMPLDLASQPQKKFGFWYKPNVTPPRSYAQWDDLITHFTQHLLERYGEAELASWYFEVWNEPNIGFWEGKPPQKTYLELYDHTARAIKAVSPKLRVGGPSTAQAAWGYDFLKHASEAHVPVDFVSSHVYANDTKKDVFHQAGSVPRDQMVCKAVGKVHDDIQRSPLPNTPLIFSEYNASYANEPNVTDSIYMGPWLATTIAQCDGLTELMSLWTFSDVFEEQGVPRTPFYGGFGLTATDHIRKPALNALAALHQLGDTRYQTPASNALVTRRADGTWVVAVWNYAAPDGVGAQYTPPTHTSDAPLEFQFRLPAGMSSARLFRVDQTHGNVITLYDQMGRPDRPSPTQTEQLKAASQAAKPETVMIDRQTLTLAVPRQGLMVVELK